MSIYSPLIESDVTPENQKHASRFSAIINLTNTIVGAGILAVPYATKCAGVILGGFFLLVVSVLVWGSLQLYIKVGEKSGTWNFQKLSLQILGSRGAIIQDLIIIIYTLGTCTAYCIVIGDFFPEILKIFFGDSYFLNRYWVTILLATVIFLPLSLLPKVDFLKTTSFVSLLCAFYAVGVVFFNYFLSSTSSIHSNDTVNYGKVDEITFLSVPIYGVAFTCHYNLFHIFQELDPKNRVASSNITLYTILITLILYIFMGIFGYLTFLSDTDPDIFRGYDVNQPIFATAYFAYSITICFSFPLICFALRQSIECLLRDKFPSKLTQDSTYSRFFITISIIITTVVLALLVKDISIVYGFTGSICSVAIVYIYPALFYLRRFSWNIPSEKHSISLSLKQLSPISNNSSSELPNHKLYYIFSICLFLFGGFVFLTGFFSAIINVYH